MVFFKKVDIRDQRDRLGCSQKGIFAMENISKGEKIWFCECGDKDGSYTRKQLLDIISNEPRLDYFVRSFSYMIDDDLYALPNGYMEEKNNDECALFNHSCNPSCGFIDDGFADNIVACRDIEPGEELTYHYGLLETEASLILGLKCKCNSSNCSGKLTFDYYRDPVFVAKHFDYMTPYLKQKTLDMKNKWYSSNCYVKRFIPFTEESSGDSSDDLSLCGLEDWDKGLCSLNQILTGELVASFCLDSDQSDEISERKHFIRNSLNPNCSLIGSNVYANRDISAETEITIFYPHFLS